MQRYGRRGVAIRKVRHRQGRHRMKTSGSLSPLRPIRSIHVRCRAVGGRRYSFGAVFPINNSLLRDLADRRPVSGPTRTGPDTTQHDITRHDTTHAFRNNSALCARAHACHDLDLFSLSTRALNLRGAISNTPSTRSNWPRRIACGRFRLVACSRTIRSAGNWYTASIFLRVKSRA